MHRATNPPFKSQEAGAPRRGHRRVVCIGGANWPTRNRPARVKKQLLYPRAFGVELVDYRILRIHVLVLAFNMVAHIVLPRGCVRARRVWTLRVLRHMGELMALLVPLRGRLLAACTTCKRLCMRFAMFVDIASAAVMPRAPWVGALPSTGGNLCGVVVFRVS